MDAFKYWENRYEKGQTGWHRSEVHSFLTDHTSDLDLSSSKRVFIPLCGRCLELKWFYEKDMEVVGVDMIEAPVKQFFEEHSLDFVEKDLSWAKLYETNDGRLKVYVCNIYDMDVAEVGKFDVIWDRASLLDIGEEDRDRYVQLMKDLLNEEFLYLLSTLQFDDTNATIPMPKSIPLDKIEALYGEWCNVNLINTAEIVHERLSSLLNTDKIEELYVLLTPK